MEFRWKSEWTVPSVVGVVSFGVGAAVGYAISQYRYNRTERFNPEEFVISLSQLRDNTTNGEVVLDFTEVLEEVEEPEEFEEIVLVEDEVEIVDIRRSVFPVDTSDWDYETELANRTSEKPYVIHKDEFMNNEAGYGQVTLTYYKGDDVLLDDKDVPLYDAKNIVGDTQNLEFGKGSEDPSVVYIRNDHLEAEYEVLLDHGYYQVEVLGEEIEHGFDSTKPPLHKFRD